MQYHNGKDTVNKFTILNRAFESPTLATGGDGRYSIYFAGASVMLATCLFWVYTKKKNKHEEN